MRLNKVKVGFVITGSHCNLDKATATLKQLMDEGAAVTPVVSGSVAGMDTRFGKAAHWLEKVREITGKEPLASITAVEPIGPGKLLDVVVVCPCSGNTMAKLANAVTDTPATMAVKAHVRNGRPVVLAVTTNDALGLNARNLGVLLAARYYFFVPFGQDDPEVKPTSIAPAWEQTVPAVEAALGGRQLQPVLVQLKA